MNRKAFSGYETKVAADMESNLHRYACFSLIGLGVSKVHK